MTDPWDLPDRHADDEPELRDLFATYRAGYEPDEAAIWSRFSELRDGSGATPAPTGRTAWWGRGIAVGAVAVVAAALVVVYLQPPPEQVRTADPGPAAVVTSDPAPVDGPVSTLPSPSGDLPAPGGDPTSTVPPGDGTATTAVPSTGGTTGVDTGSGQAGSIGMAVEALPSTLLLSAADQLDWVIVGARSDGTPITLDDRDPLITVLPGGTPTWDDAPIDITWTDGSPEEVRAGNGHWWSVPAAAAAFQITVAVPATADQVAVYAGGSGQVVVTAAVDGRDSGQEVPLPAASSGAGTGGVVRIDVTGAGGRELTITIGGSSTGTTVSLGAVAIR